MAANRHFGISKETTWGEEVAIAPVTFLELLSESVKVEKEWETIGTLRGYSVSDVSELSSIVRGDTEFLANFEGMVKLFWALIGSESSTTATGIQTHVFPDAAAGIGDADRIGNSWQLEIARGADPLVWRYYGCKPISMGLSFAVDASSRLTVGWVGKSEVKGGNKTDSTGLFPALAPFKPKNITVKVADSEVCARNVEINIENPVDESFCLGAVGLGAEQDRSDYLKVTGSMECLFTDFTEYDTFNGTAGVSSTASVEVDVAGTVPGDQNCNFLLNKCQITQATPSISGRDRLAATYEFESMFNTALTENIVITTISSDAELTP